MNERPHLDQEIVRLMNKTKGYKLTPPNDSMMDIRTGSVLISGLRIPFEPKLLLDGKIQMILPQDFRSIPPENVYKPEARPDVLLVEEGGAIQITIAHLFKQAVNDDEVASYKSEVEELLKALNSSSEWLSEGIKQVYEKQICFFEFVTPMMNTKIYNLSFFLELQQRILTGNFVCDERKVKGWKPFFFQMIESIEIKVPVAEG